jgi:hypothetical protein
MVWCVQDKSASENSKVVSEQSNTVQGEKEMQACVYVKRLLFQLFDWIGYEFLRLTPHTLFSI